MEKIESNLRNLIDSATQHPFSMYRNYYDFFIEALHDMNCINMFFDTQKKRDKLFRNLQLKGEYDQSTYCQGISEVMLWIHLLKNGSNFNTFNIDKKISTINNADVDIQLKIEGYTYNIEVKCPTVHVENEDTLLVKPLFRGDSKELIQNFNEELKETLNESIKCKITPYNNVKIGKINDNKMMDYLKSAQQKFCSSTNKVCNVLFVAIPIEEMEDYYAYLFNGQTGIFTGQKPILDNDKFSHVDVIILSSLVDGHFNPAEDYNSWKLEEYFNLMLVNPHKAHINPDARRKLLSIIPNDTCRFEEFYEEFRESHPEELMPLLFPNYINYYYSRFSK